jgi:nucleotide-binding universal stress UspA family protein
MPEITKPPRHPRWEDNGTVIVVAHHGQPDCSAALDWAAHEARRRDTPLRVVFVLSVPAVLVGPGGTAGGIPEDVVDAAREVTVRAEEWARELGVKDVEKAVEIGSPAAVLVQESHDAELVVVGCRGRGDLASALLGSVSLAVAAHAHCPVVVARAAADRQVGPDFGVVVGVDGSEASERAVAFAAEAAERSAASLRVVGAWQMPYVDAFGTTVWDVAGRGTVEESLREATQRSLESVVAGLASTHPGLAVTSSVIEDDPAVALNDASREAGLVVVGSRGRGGFGGLLLGSVSHHVVHGAHCPVAVVK